MANYYEENSDYSTFIFKNHSLLFTLCENTKSLVIIFKIKSTKRQINECGRSQFLVVTQKIIRNKNKLTDLNNVHNNTTHVCVMYTTPPHTRVVNMKSLTSFILPKLP